MVIKEHWGIENNAFPVRIVTRKTIEQNNISLLNLFWNPWLSLQCDWLSAVRFIHEPHYLFLQIASFSQPMRMGQ